jgi:hypothetical protein
MRKQRNGTIVNISSMVGRFGVANTILSAVNSKDPDLRYVIGNDANSIHMRNSLSDRRFMKWIRDGMFHGKGVAR